MNVDIKSPLSLGWLENFLLFTLDDVFVFFVDSDNNDQNSIPSTCIDRPCSFVFLLTLDVLDQYSK